MIGTLIKHEAIRTRGMLLTVAGGAAALVALGSLMALTGWPILAQLGAVLAIGGALGLVPALQLAQAVDYWRSGYGRIGYFTQTLPVRGARIYAAKAAWGLLVLVAGLVLTLALGLVVALSTASLFGSDPARVLGVVGDAIATAYATAPWLVAVVGPLGVVLLYAQSMLLYFCAASIGSEQPLQRLSWGGPVLVWFALYTAVQLVMLVLILAIPVGIGMTGAGELGLVQVDLLRAMLEDTDPAVMPIGFVPATVLVTAVLVWCTARSWNRKVSLA